MSAQATITAKFVNAPKPGGKFGNIKDQTDNVWFAEPADIANVQRGQTITVEYEVQKWTKGPVNVINRVLDEAPRTQGTQAPQVVMDKDTRIFVCGFLQSLVHSTGIFPGREQLAQLILDTRSAYEWAFNQPLRPLQFTRQATPGTQASRQNNYQAHDPREEEDIPL